MKRFFRFLSHPHYGEGTYLVLYDEDLDSDDFDILFRGSPCPDDVYEAISDLVGEDWYETGMWRIDPEDIERIREGMTSMRHQELEGFLVDPPEEDADEDSVEDPPYTFGEEEDE